MCFANEQRLKRGSEKITARPRSAALRIVRLEVPGRDAEIGSFLTKSLQKTLDIVKQERKIQAPDSVWELRRI